MNDCKTEAKESSEQSNELEKAFIIGMAIGFGKKYDEMDRIMEEIKALESQPKTGTLEKIKADIDFHATTFIEGKRYIEKDFALDIIDKYGSGSEE